jgi:UDP:flavonoid glycosyltransferase YjiC (YdhE family)
MKNILIAPLNWGLGHATRSIPIIKALEENGYTPIIASDGVALALLKKEFSHLIALELPSYNIEYAKKAADFKWKLIKNTPRTLMAMHAEKKLVEKWIADYNLIGIISDNRLGVHSKKVPSVFITHQLTVLSGNTTWLTSKLHQFYIRKFDECWVPDVNESVNLTGQLGHLKSTSLNLKYIGILSRLQKLDLPIVYDLMVILSGPEPQRTMLEEKLIFELDYFDGTVVFIKGKVEAEQLVAIKENITYYNFMQTEQLEKTFNESETVVCRSGYTTVMDLVKMEKKALFIPTPGQFEQEFLAKKYKAEGILPSSKQHKFNMVDVYKVSFYPGFPNIKSEVNWPALFALFERK